MVHHIGGAKCLSSAYSDTPTDTPVFPSSAKQCLSTQFDTTSWSLICTRFQTSMLLALTTSFAGHGHVSDSFASRMNLISESSSCSCCSSIPDRRGIHENGTNCSHAVLRVNRWLRNKRIIIDPSTLITRVITRVLWHNTGMVEAPEWAKEQLVSQNTVTDRSERVLDSYELPKCIPCCYAFSDAYSVLDGALGMTSCKQSAWEDNTKLTRYIVCRKGVTRVRHPCLSLLVCSPVQSGFVMVQDRE